MTPEPGTGHPDVEALDGYAGGDTTDRDVVAHVAGCPACGAVVEGLIRVRVDLARLRPVPMPDDVAARIRAALRAEPPPVSAGGAGGAGGASVGRAPRTRRVPGLPRRPAAAKLATAAAAGVTALAVGVGMLTSSGGTAAPA
ncbi:MAG TPA: hypothetical protein VKP11_10890, partial [Frankiaceae bacterium]|nr:hypothetical protein [Frankiaceae bacterium]